MTRFPWSPARRKSALSQVKARKLCCEPLERREVMTGSIDGYAFLADSGVSQGVDVASDAAGNTYIAGRLGALSSNQATGPIDLDPNPDVVVPLEGSIGGGATFIVKYGPSGEYLWHIASDAGGDITDLEIAENGGVFFTGSYSGTFELGGQQISTTGTRLFLGEVDSSGSVSWLSSINYGVTKTVGLDVDEAHGRIFVSGTRNVNFITSMFVLGASYTPAGATQLWTATTTPTGSPADMNIYDLELDAAGNPITVGAFQGTADFDPGSGKLSLSSGSGRNRPYSAYVWKLNGANGSVAWAKSFTAGSGGYSNALALATDANSNVYVGGFFSGTVDFDPGKGTRNLSHPGSGFVAALTSSGALSYVVAHPAGIVDITLTTVNNVPYLYAVGGGDNGEHLVYKLDVATGAQLSSASFTGGRDCRIAVSASGVVNVIGTFNGLLDWGTDLEDEANSTDDAMYWLVVSGL
jgi:hypothetical protein